jgi:hypothetical protein
MKVVVMFSQSPSDIRYVLSIYEQYKNKFKVKIYIIGVRGNYIFLKNILPKVDIEYINTPTMKQIFFNPFHLIRIRILKRKICLENVDNIVYFFSRYVDYYTAFLIDSLKKQNIVYYIDSVYSFLDVNISYAKNINVITIFKSIYLFFIFFKKSVFINHSGRQIYYYQSKSLINNKSISIDNSIYKEYSFRPKFIYSKKPKLIFFESGGRTGYFSDYEKNLERVLSVISKKFTVYIKPHPTHNYSKIADKFNILLIEKNTPSEFLNLTEFSVVLGIESASIALVNHDNKISVIDAFVFRDILIKDDFKRYLNDLSPTKIRYIDDIEKI